MGRVKDYLLGGGEHLEVGMRVRVVDGLPSNWGKPLGVIRGIGPEMVRVELFYDESVHYFEPQQLRRRMKQVSDDSEPTKEGTWEQTS